MSLWGKTLSRLFLPSLVASLSVAFHCEASVFTVSLFSLLSLSSSQYSCVYLTDSSFLSCCSFPQPLSLTPSPLAFCVRLICTFHWVCKSILLSRLPSSAIRNEAEDVAMGIRLWKWAQVSHCDSWHLIFILTRLLHCKRVLGLFFLYFVESVLWRCRI